MDQSEKDQLINRLNIVAQQRNSFLDQLVLLQEQVNILTQKLEEAEKKVAAKSPTVEVVES
jgi:hypothetical protein